MNLNIKHLFTTDHYRINNLIPDKTKINVYHLIFYYLKKDINIMFGF